MWRDPGAWIAIGISMLFLVVAFGMHRVFVKILKTPPEPEASAASPSVEKKETDV